MRLTLLFRSKLNSSEIEKRKHAEELHAFKKMSVSDSGQESFNSSSGKEGKI